MMQIVKKGSLTANEYLLKIQNIVDRLASVHIVSASDHIEAIFNGLLEDYDAIVITSNSQSEIYMIEERESLTLAQESQIEKHCKDLDLNCGSINMTTHNTWNRKQFRGGNSNSTPQNLNVKIKNLLNIEMLM